MKELECHPFRWDYNTLLRSAVLALSWRVNISEFLEMFWVLLWIFESTSSIFWPWLVHCCIRIRDTCKNFEIQSIYLRYWILGISQFTHGRRHWTRPPWRCLTHLGPVSGRLRKSLPEYHSKLCGCRFATMKRHDDFQNFKIFYASRAKTMKASWMDYILMGMGICLLSARRDGEVMVTTMKVQTREDGFWIGNGMKLGIASRRPYVSRLGCWHRDKGSPSFVKPLKIQQVEDSNHLRIPDSKPQYGNATVCCRNKMLQGAPNFGAIRRDGGRGLLTDQV